MDKKNELSKYGIYVERQKLYVNVVVSILLINIKNHLIQQLQITENLLM